MIWRACVGGSGGAGGGRCTRRRPLSTGTCALTPIQSKCKAPSCGMQGILPRRVHRCDMVATAGVRHRFRPPDPGTCPSERRLRTGRLAGCFGGVRSAAALSGAGAAASPAAAAAFAGALPAAASLAAAPAARISIRPSRHSLSALSNRSVMPMAGPSCAACSGSSFSAEN